MALDDVLASVNVSSGVVTSYATDALGSVVGVLNSSGSVAGSYGYDPYGNTAASGATSTLQNTGRDNDGAYYYYRARYYDPARHRPSCFQSSSIMRHAQCSMRGVRSEAGLARR